MPGQNRGRDATHTMYQRRNTLETNWKHKTHTLVSTSSRLRNRIAQLGKGGTPYACD